MDEGFAPGIGEKLRSYVYLLVDPRTGRAFFAGRGRNDRCFRHVQAARVEHETTPVAVGAEGPGPTDIDAPERANDTSEAGNESDPGNDKRGSRAFPVLDRIREIEATGRSVRIDILRYGLNPDEARLVEATARDALGLPLRSPDRRGGAATPSDTGQAFPNQRTEAATLNTVLAKPAKIKRSHRVVLLRLGKSFGPATSDAQLEQAVRSPWTIGRRWTDPQSRRSPQWAFVVVDGLVRAVYRIDGWKQAVPASTIPPSSTRPARWTLAGERDPELERKYRGRNVSAYLSPGSQNPVTYVWCGPHWVNSPA
ncbi:MAG TPA: hypothetical protein VNV87_04865 [Acidimicrobiales bacterium]|jgi:hypothetical protein|nr:hypothetical protein [Acidimicrobiales bacterium]